MPIPMIGMTGDPHPFSVVLVIIFYPVDLRKRLYGCFNEAEQLIMQKVLSTKSFLISDFSFYTSIARIRSRIFFSLREICTCVVPKDSAVCCWV